MEHTGSIFYSLGGGAVVWKRLEVVMALLRRISVVTRTYLL
jgi:hypothetical protein